MPKEEASAANPAKPLDIAIVGAGFGGMYMLHRARKAGWTAKAFDAASDVGGTWYWNRYPGARCDIESMQYSYSFDEDLQQEWNWSERFATQPEILDYARHVADRFDLKRDIQFNTRIEGVHYDERDKLWTLKTDGGETVRARYAVMATGCLSTARLPDIAGRDSFEGATYHTGDWPHEGVDLTGLKVAVIGTGSSAIQAIPVMAEQAAELTVFQRTPNYSVPARNQAMTEDYAKSWKQDYARFRKEARETTRSGILYDFPQQSALEASEAEREEIYRARWEIGGTNFASAFNDLLLNADSNFTAAEFVRERIREIVKDPETAETLSPKDYPIFTKRICVDTDYFATFNRANVSLIDLRKTPIEEITPAGVRTSDQERAFDAIVFATGFDAMTGALTSMDLRGRGGRSLSEKWAEGPRAYLGLMAEGFPNLFMVTGPGSPSVLSNMIVSIEQHVDLICSIVTEAESKSAASVEAEQAAEDAWVAHVNQVASATLYPKAASWYMGANIPGKPRVFMPYIGVDQYRARCNEVVQSGFEGLKIA